MVEGLMWVGALLGVIATSLFSVSSNLKKVLAELRSQSQGMVHIHREIAALNTRASTLVALIGDHNSYLKTGEWPERVSLEPHAPMKMQPTVGLKAERL